MSAPTERESLLSAATSDRSVLRDLVDALDSEAALTMSRRLANAWSRGRQALYHPDPYLSLTEEQAADTLALLEAVVERCYSSHHDLYDEAYALRSWFRGKGRSVV